MKSLEINISTIALLAEQNKDENYSFRNFLKWQDPD